MSTKCKDCYKIYRPKAKLVQEKLCPQCKLTLSSNNFHGNSRTSDGLQTACIRCRQGSKQEWEKQNPHRKILSRYNLSIQDYQKMLSSQNNKCAICKKVKKLSIDHCHVTGKVRGLLCTGCNTSLGGLGDTVEGLQRALQYLNATAD